MSKLRTHPDSCLTTTTDQSHHTLSSAYYQTVVNVLTFNDRIFFLIPPVIILTVNIEHPHLTVFSCIFSVMAPQSA
jgi:hypothetical protein